MENVKFDFSKVTARRMSAFSKATREGDYEGIAELFAAVVTECPDEWGAPNDPNTYLDLPMFTTFREVIKSFSEGVRDESKN